MPGSPNFVIQHMPGSGGLLADNHIYNIAPKDGTVIKLANPGVVTSQVQGTGVQYDTRKMGWIGRTESDVGVMAVWAKAPATTLEQAMTTEVAWGSSGPGNNGYIIPVIMQQLFGYKFKMVSGYTGSAEVLLAMERGEVHGRVNTWATLKQARPKWFEEPKQAVVMAAVSHDPISDLPGVRPIASLAKTPEQKEIMDFVLISTVLGRAFVAGPDIPADRLAALRKAFDDTVKDPAYLAEAAQNQSVIEPMSGDKVEALVKNAVSISPTLASKIDQMLAPK
jgi:tripartite-type tricarboxylate transporter receptor subunit TctC